MHSITMQTIKLFLLPFAVGFICSLALPLAHATECPSDAYWSFNANTVEGEAVSWPSSANLTPEELTFFTQDILVRVRYRP